MGRKKKKTMKPWCWYPLNFCLMLSLQGIIILSAVVTIFKHIKNSCNSSKLAYVMKWRSTVATPVWFFWFSNQ